MRYKGIKGKIWEEIKAYNRKREKDCYTCGRRDLSGINAQSGHYKPVAIVGSNNKWSWDIRFIHLQCSRCNGVGQGMAIEYERRLRKDYGDEVVDEFENNYRQVNPVKDWKALLEYFKNLNGEDDDITLEQV